MGTPGKCPGPCASKGLWTLRASVQGPALPRGRAPQPKVLFYVIHHDHQLLAVRYTQKCYIDCYVENPMHRQYVYVPQQQWHTQIKQANYVNETIMDTLLGTLFLIIFQAGRGLRHPRACINTGNSARCAKEMACQNTNE